MRYSRLFFAIIIIGLLPILAIPGAEAQEPAPSVDTLVASRSALDEAIAAQRRTAADQRTALEAQIARLEAQVLDTQGAIDALAVRASSAQATLDTHSAAVEAERTAWQQLLAIAMEVAQRSIDRIASGIPHHRDKRLVAWRAVAAGLAMDDPSLQSDAIVSLLDLQAAELTAARQVSWSADRVELGERQLMAYRLRVGLAVELFINESGTIGGTATGASPDWALADDEASLRALRQILLVARGREAAALVAVPVAHATVTEKPTR